VSICRIPEVTILTADERTRMAAERRAMLREPTCSPREADSLRAEIALLESSRRVAWNDQAGRVVPA
jgi:hypothetical protein